MGSETTFALLLFAVAGVALSVGSVVVVMKDDGGVVGAQSVPQAIARPEFNYCSTNATVAYTADSHRNRSKASGTCE